MRYIIILIAIFYSYAIRCQTTQKDATKTALLSNYSWGVVPVLAYDSDIGFKYGANFNIFDYGKYKQQEDYEQYLYARLVNSTNNTLETQLLFDSDRIFKQGKVVVETSYIIDQNLSFFGFNGSNSVYNSNFTDVTSPDYINRYYYTHQRKLFRIRTDYQQQLWTKTMRLYIGATLNNYNISSVDFSKHQSPNGPNNEPAEKRSLYSDYIDWGIISPTEKIGGTINYATLGFIYDNRDNQRVTRNGMWLETYGLLSPKNISDQYFSKFVFTFRHYINFPKPDMVFSYRISSQNKIGGKIPFYMLPTYFGSQINRDGVGGAFNMRGVIRNRIAADGYAVGNFELRKQTLHFRFLKLNFDILASVFSDVAYITQEYEFNTSEIPDEYKNSFFKNDKQTLTATYGVGVYIIYNKNNIMSVYYGSSFNKQLGNNGVYVGSSYLF